MTFSDLSALKFDCRHFAVPALNINACFKGMASPGHKPEPLNFLGNKSPPSLQLQPIQAFWGLVTDWDTFLQRHVYRGTVTQVGSYCPIFEIHILLSIEPSCTVTLANNILYILWSLSQWRKPRLMQTSQHKLSTLHFYVHRTKTIWTSL